MDVTTIVGLIFALLAILGGQALEGGSVGSIIQPTAALIVVGGTLGAIAVQFPLDLLKRAALSMKQVFLPEHPDTTKLIKLIVSLATKARRDGLVAIERDVEAIEDPFLKRGLELAVDGTDARVLRSAMELELSRFEEEEEAAAKVLEAAGGYSPTIGIIGAVLGLIHVMENLSDPTKLGSGIAVAFVATVYGVGLANLVYLPMAAKLKLRVHEKVVSRELVIEGAVALAEGENPHLIERKLGIVMTEKRESIPVGVPKPARSAPVRT